MKTYYIVVLGGTGFNADFLRFKIGANLAKKAGATLVVCGMGVQNHEYEYQFLARNALTKGISTVQIIPVMSDEKHRSHQDEVKHVMEKLAWIKHDGTADISFITEGWLRASLIKMYALLQKPKWFQAKVHCVDSGEKVPWRRRLLNLRSVFKFFYWSIFKK